ncbi:hypothetical protein GCM10023080_040130 [Streptomyces pseudoechinosporeus]
MVSLPEEREAVARRRVDELQAETEGLSVHLEGAREDLARLVVTRVTVAEVLAELSAMEAEKQADGAAADPPEVKDATAARGIGVVMVPPWREGLVAGVLPDVCRDIVEVVSDAPGPLQAKQIVPRIGLTATTVKIEGTRGKLKRLVERGWLDEDAPGQFTLARGGRSRDRVTSR